MADATQFAFSHKELVTVMLKSLDIHSGIWGLHLKFGLAGMNAGPNENELMPAAVIPVLEIGLQKFEKVTSLSVDAAVANPPKVVSSTTA